MSTSTASVSTRGILLLASALLLLSCGGSQPGEAQGPAVIRIKGSDTMLQLTTRWAGEFMRNHADIAVYAEGGGTESGIEALIDGDVQLCAASRTLLPDEVRRLLKKRGYLGITVLTAKDALSVYLHPRNTVRSLSMEQLRGLFNGSIRNWSEVGGPNLPVLVVSRQPNSGTYLFFEEHVLRGDAYSTAAMTLPTTEAVIRAVAASPGAIGYGGLAYGADLVHCAIDGVEPTMEKVRDGSYPISRYLYLFAAGPLTGPGKTFIDWVLSDEGQAIVAGIGYIPLWDVRKEME
ncbi:MAG TPA: phosphate ABC transporter substrate-binding protein [Bacteroidota bacterium]|nr:phosphate ABC transporter substrate-binding protein [Bacteroidota bacterium]